MKKPCLKLISIFIVMVLAVGPVYSEETSEESVSKSGMHAEGSLENKSKGSEYVKARDGFVKGVLLKTERDVSRKIKGCSGNEVTFDCVISVEGVLTFTTDGTVVGEIVDLGSKFIHRIEGEVYSNGSILLKDVNRDGWIGYVFMGKFENDRIIGLWEKGGGKKGFMFSIKVQQV